MNATATTVDALKLSSQEWMDRVADRWPGAQVLDADGWDRTRFFDSWDELITQAEFWKRFTGSTIAMPQEMILALTRNEGNLE